MIFDFQANNILDLSPLFQSSLSESNLLQGLNIFEKAPSKTIDVAIDRVLLDHSTLLNEPQKRYSPHHNSTKRSEYSSYIVELPQITHREDQVSAYDIQRGNRRLAGQAAEETKLAVISEYVAKHVVSHQRAVELAYARSLWKGQVITPFTVDAPEILWTDAFDADFMQGALDLSDDTIDVLEVFDGFLTQVQLATGSLYSSVKRYVCFCSADFYQKLRYHASMRHAFEFTSPNDSRNIVYQNQALGNTTTFSFNNIDFIKVVDPLIAGELPLNGAVLMPIFNEGTNAHVHQFGPCSTDTDIAASGDVREYYSLGYRGERGAYSVVSEASLLGINHATAMTMQIVNSAP